MGSVHRVPDGVVSRKPRPYVSPISDFRNIRHFHEKTPGRTFRRIELHVGGKRQAIAGSGAGGAAEGKT
jgi:hypothetical protein